MMSLLQFMEVPPFIVIILLSFTQLSLGMDFILTGELYLTKVDIVNCIALSIKKNFLQVF